MSESYDIVIIGGGIIGAAVAYHLAKKNYGKIAVVEKDQYLGNCSTAKCAGGIRAQFSSEINVRMSLLSEDKFETFAQDMDAEAQVRRSKPRQRCSKSTRGTTRGFDLRDWDYSTLIGRGSCRDLAAQRCYEETI